MKLLKISLAVAAACLGVAVVAYAGQSQFHEVRPNEFDPGKTRLVNAAWLEGLGCPTNSKYFPGTPATYTDPACPVGDVSDKKNEGLLLVKTGPTDNIASAIADLKNVRGITLTELGYDIRKGGAPISPIGSHCGAGAPRFNVTTSDGVTHFVGCNSPPGIPGPASQGWTRLRWNAVLLAAAFPPITPTDEVRSIQIVFDEGQDVGPDFFGGAILDNIDVNGVLVGQGPTDPGSNPKRH